MTTRRVSIVILCWNRWSLTERCLETLLRHTDLESVDVLVVDNGSTDETPRRLKEFDRIKVVTNCENLGYVRGNNAGIAAADPTSDILLLNNDVEFTSDGWLDRLREAASSAPDIGVVGCRLVLPDGRLLHAGTYILPETFWGQQIGSLETDVEQFAGNRDVQGIVFACAYIKREVIAKIGGLSLDYVSYFEDTDFCLRAKEAGFRTICCGGVTLVHHEHGSTSDMPGMFDDVFQKSRAVFSKRWKETLENRYKASVHWQSVIGFSHGYAMTAREMLRGLDERGLKMSYSYVYGPGTPVPLTEPDNTGDYYLNVIKGRKHEPHPEISVVYAQGDVFKSAIGRHRIGYTMLEVDGFPAEWVRQANGMDEVWTPTQANRDAMVRCGVTRPIYVMPLGVNTDRFHPHAPGYRNPTGDYVFLSAFEWGERKAPGLLLKTFNDTFRRSDPVVLVCKVNNRNGGISIRREIEALRLRSSGGRIAFVFNKDVPYGELPSLYRSADCFISAGLGEGWDMPLMEAMACGLPSIATDWGAHTQFINEGNSYPLLSRGTIPAVALCPYYKGFSWANPDGDHLAKLFRHIYENRDEAAEIGRRAAAEVAERWSVDAMNDRIAARLFEIAGQPGKTATRVKVRASAPSRPVVALDVSRAIGEQMTGVGRYAWNAMHALARHGANDFEYLALPGFGDFVHPEYGKTYTCDSPWGKNVSVYRGALPAFGAPGTAAPEVALVHSTGHMVPDRCPAPLLFTAHDLSFLTHPEFHTRENIELCTRNYRKARDTGATFLAVSEHTKRDLMELLEVPQERIRVVPNTFDERLFHPMAAEELVDNSSRFDFPKDYFLYLGSLEPRKNLATALEAVTRVDVGAPLLIVGARGWNNRDLFGKVERAGKRVRMVGYMGSDHIPAVIGAARALVYPSLYEGFGLPVLEALACGTPVVTTRVSSLPEVGGDAAVYLDDPTDAAALATALRGITDDPEERRRLSRGALAQAQKFGMKAVAEKLVAVYREHIGD